MFKNKNSLSAKTDREHYVETSEGIVKYPTSSDFYKVQTEAFSGIFVDDSVKVSVVLPSRDWNEPRIQEFYHRVLEYCAELEKQNIRRMNQESQE